MANLSTDAVKRLMISTASKDAGNEVASAVNNGSAVAAQSGWTIKGLIVATNVSTTIDFASLVVGDKILVSPAVDGNSHFLTVAVAATLPEAAVVGSLYVVMRALTLPTASALVF